MPVLLNGKVLLLILTTNPVILEPSMNGWMVGSLVGWTGKALLVFG